MTPDAAADVLPRSRIAVVTAVAAGKDRLADPDVDATGADFLAFVDERQDHVTRWDQRPLPRWSCDPRFAARRDAKVAKVIPWLLAPGYDFYIWMDGNFTLSMDPRKMCDRLLAGTDADIALFRHPWRRCIYEESEVVLRLGLERPDVLQSQVSAYRAAGYPAMLGLYAASSFVWRSSAASTRLALVWWDQICRFSSRDQLSLPVALWLTGSRPALIDGSSHLDNPYVRKVADHLVPSRHE